MKLRTVTVAFALMLLAACGGNTPTGARAPERAALDGAPVDTSTTARGGSFGPGH